MKKINEHYLSQNASRVVPVNPKNIVIIGRSKTGKSTIKSMLVNPTKVPTELSLISDTREASIESYFIDGTNFLLNIIDTPGLFESYSDEAMVRDNGTILKVIEKCINLEITKFHLICFAFSMPAGIQSDDVSALQLFIDHLGPDLSKNSCLIITRAESKTEGQRNRLLAELLNDLEFKRISTYFERGIFFTGAINYDDYEAGHASITDQYMAVLEYRKALLNVFSQECEPFEISKSYIGYNRRLQEQKEKEMQVLRSQLVKSESEKVEERKASQMKHEELQRAMFNERKRTRANNGICPTS